VKWVSDEAVEGTDVQSQDASDRKQVSPESTFNKLVEMAIYITKIPLGLGDAWFRSYVSCVCM
jgi:hypothetical protein